ncbi:MAG: GspE/PulE family protein [Gammaproteobacteria bacterium]|nr:GspE/PulE family protein [Gammaproteobacteria bacterium]
MIPRKKIRLGDLLVQNKVISENQLNSALAIQKKSGRKLGRVLIENNFVEEDKLLDFLSRQLQIPFVDLRYYKFSPDTVRLLSETYARRFRTIVLEEKESDYLIGMADPTDIFAYDELARMLKRPLRLALVREADLLRTLDTVYRRTEEIISFAEKLGEEMAANEFDLAGLAQAADVTDAPVVKLLQSMFEDAVQIGASDIHIEPDEHALRIRQRIDGVLHEQLMKEKHIASALVSRLKLMSGLDIAEKRLPQDGRFTIKVKDRVIDVRLSTMPIYDGEAVVMRLLDKTGGLLNLDQLGMTSDMLRRFHQLITKPQGMVLITGPTGSGKTTTLYAALSHINNAESKIITVEDPVEYRLPRINQVQVNAKIGLSFARVLRSALRHDPDIVLVGEMRDQETAEIGLRAAMTGHLVLSTLHTNDSISCATRLLDMGAEGYMVAAALDAVIAQRLVRRICASCAEPYQLDTHQLAWLRGLTGAAAEGMEFRHGEGCPHCNNTGYRGRIGVYELLEIDEALGNALRREDVEEFRKLAKQRLGHGTLIECALEYARAGTTTIDEVMRVFGEGEEIEETPPPAQELPAGGKSAARAAHA